MIQGNWTYQRCFNSQNGARGSLALEGVPWTPLGTLSVKQGSDGQLTGTMTCFLRALQGRTVRVESQDLQHPRAGSGPDCQPKAIG
jgi:hypothetical protein